MHGRSRRVALRLGAVAACAAAAVAFEVRSSSAQHAATQLDVTAPASVPAVVAKATRQDVPIYVTGVGSVEAYQSVLIRARVDGMLTVAYPSPKDSRSSRAISSP